MLKICYRDFSLLPVTARMLIEHMREKSNGASRDQS
jgi:hypothetical protein